MSNDNYQNPLSTKTPTMTVAAVLEWLDLEIEFVLTFHDAQSEPLAKIIAKGIVVHLTDMKNQLQNHTLKRMDEDTK